MIPVAPLRLDAEQLQKLLELGQALLLELRRFNDARVVAATGERAE